MLKKMALIVFLIALSAASGLEPIPPGTPSGQVTIHVADCTTERPIIGASVNLDNPTHRVSGVTNATGHVVLTLYEWFYSYYITASGYRIAAGERRFTIGELFQVCLFPETAGFWRIIASVSMWQGDIHAGGLGWAVIRLKNLEEGKFNITEFQIRVSGYDGPAITYSIPSGFILDRLVEKEVNITVAPRPDIPVGRLKAELLLRTTFTSADGRTIGPLTANTDLDYVYIQPYRTFSLRIVDRWGSNPVSDAAVIMEPTLPGTQATYTFKTDNDGYIYLKRIPDGAYLTRILYNSPYDGQVHLVKQFFPILVDLVREGVVTTSLYEAHVAVRDLAGRRLDTEVSLGSVSGRSSDGLAVFKNVPRGIYETVVKWMGVEVFRDMVRVDEPLIVGSPGGYVDAEAAVGDLAVKLLKNDGKPLQVPVRVKLTPLDREISAVDRAVFEMLPAGSYRISVSYLNPYRGVVEDVGSLVLSIPRDHGEHVIRLSIFDAEVRIVDTEGRTTPIKSLKVGERNIELSGESALLRDITPGPYLFEGSWKNFTVIRQTVNIAPNTPVVLNAQIYRMNVTITGFDGSQLPEGLIFLDVGGEVLESRIVNGSAVFDMVPAGKHAMRVIFREKTVFEGFADAGRSVSVTTDAGSIVLVFRDQRGVPVQGVVVDVQGVGSGRTNADGFAFVGIAPRGEYRYTAKYSGFAVSSGNMQAGQQAAVQLPLYSAKVEVVNELGSPVEAVIEISRDGVLLKRLTASEALIERMPPGLYVVTATKGAKQSVEQFTLQSEGQVFRVTLPYILELGPVMLSKSDIYTIITPVAVAALGIVSAAALSRAVRRKGKRPVGRV
jgi:hypothetical protein